MLKIMQCVLGLQCHPHVKSDDTQNISNITQTTFLTNNDRIFWEFRYAIITYMLEIKQCVYDALLHYTGSEMRRIFTVTHLCMGFTIN